MPINAANAPDKADHNQAAPDKAAPDQSDFSLADHGSVVILTPLSDLGVDWTHEHLGEDCLRFGRGYAIEPRYVGPILDGIAENGLSVEAL